MKYFVEVKTCGYPNGKVIETECIGFFLLKKQNSLLSIVKILLLIQILMLLSVLL